MILYKNDNNNNDIIKSIAYSVLMCHDYTNIIQKEKSKKKQKPTPESQKRFIKENNYQKLPLMLN